MERKYHFLRVCSFLAWPSPWTFVLHLIALKTLFIQFSPHLLVCFLRMACEVMTMLLIFESFISVPLDSMYLLLFSMSLMSLIWIYF